MRAAQRAVPSVLTNRPRPRRAALGPRPASSCAPSGPRGEAGDGDPDGRGAGAPPPGAGSARPIPTVDDGSTGTARPTSRPQLAPLAAAHPSPPAPAAPCPRAAGASMATHDGRPAMRARHRGLRAGPSVPAPSRARPRPSWRPPSPWGVPAPPSRTARGASPWDRPGGGPLPSDGVSGARGWTAGRRRLTRTERTRARGPGPRSAPVGTRRCGSPEPFAARRAPV